MTRSLQADWHHLHLNSPDPAASAAWYAGNLGGRARSVGSYHLALFDGPFLIWNESAAPPPSVGSTVDHLGFSVSDLDASLERVLAAGAELLQGATQVGALKICFVTDPWGAKLELLEDSELLGFHHVHLLVPDQEAHQTWLCETVGGRADTFNGLLRGVRFSSAWVLYRESPGELEATSGRAIDHLGFRVGDVDRAAEVLAAASVELEREPYDVGDVRVLFFGAPRGVRVELLQTG